MDLFFLVIYFRLFYKNTALYDSLLTKILIQIIVLIKLD